MQTQLSDFLANRRCSRRTLLGGTAALAVAASAQRRNSLALAATNLDFVVWSYNVQLVQDNIKQFQQQYPELTVKLSDFPWNNYHEVMVNRFQSKTPTDVAYNGGDWLEEFAKAQWVVPLQDHFSWVLDYKDKILPFAWQDMTYQDKVYGLPYYADTCTFMYNAKILQDNGIKNPPDTWEELTEQGKFLKGKGIEYPFIYELDQTLPTITEVFTSMVFGRGGELFDEQRNPLWTDPKSPAAAQFKWLVDARNKDKILTWEKHETVVVPAMNTGKHVYSVMYNYDLASLNNKAVSPLAGQFKLGLMPGKTHECYGFAKFYNMTQMAVDRGQDVVKDCGQFIQYFGGEVNGQFAVAKRWAVQDGLGFAQKPLFDDPDVKKAFSQWIDVDLWKKQLDIARAARHSIWYGIWSEFFRQQYVKAMAGEISADDALEASAKQWDKLKKQVEG